MKTSVWPPFVTKSFVAGVCSLLLFTGASIHADDQLVIQSGQKLAFLGDSITANGWGSHGGYVKLIVDGLEREGVKVTPIPAGVSGNTSRDMLARLDRDVLSKHPDWMTLSCGVNDVWHGINGVELEQYKKNITSIVDQAAAAGVKVVIMTSTPIGEDDNANNQKLVPYNDFLRQLAHDRALPLADTNTAMQPVLKSIGATPTSRILTVDGVHMNPEGNVIMAKTCLAAFGVSTASLAKIEEAWLARPDTALFSGGSAPKGELSIGLGQYRMLEKIARQEGTDMAHLEASVWLRVLGEVLQKHISEPLLDPAKVQNEATALLPVKLDEMLKKQAL